MPCKHCYNFIAQTIPTRVRGLNIFVFMRLISDDLLDKTAHCRGIRNISPPCNHGARPRFRVKSALDNQAFIPVSSRTLDRDRIAKTMYRHHSRICPEIARKCDINLTKICPKPVCNPHGNRRHDLGDDGTGTCGYRTLF